VGEPISFWIELRPLVAPARPLVASTRGDVSVPRKVGGCTSNEETEARAP
jgi:hypothetical protein